MSALQKEVLTKHLPPLPQRPAFPRLGSSDGGGPKRRKRDYSPLPWSDFFDRQQDIVTTPGNCFRVYFKGNSGPVLLLLHGGGHSALSWALFAVAVSELAECEVIAVDLRGHGNSVSVDDDDLSADTQVSDVGALVEALFSERESHPPVVLVGHSMGGAIAVRAAAKGAVKSLVGIAVIDVVEGTAMESLNSMQSYLRGRPSKFKSLEEAIEWSIRSGQLRNSKSARVSMPGQVRRSVGQPTPGSDVPPQPPSSPPQHSHAPQLGGVIQEEEEEEEGEESAPKAPSHPEGVTSSSSSGSLSGGGGGYVWRIDLQKTECYWRGWFDGLSKEFLSIPQPKMLILAGVDRLDKDLTIGQMQGKFQMMVMSGCGHSVHEDAPEKVADVVGRFLLRHKLTKRKEPLADDSDSKNSVFPFKHDPDIVHY